MELEGFRAYLALLARLQLDARLQGKVDLSGVVQQTLLEAHQVLDRSTSRDITLKAAWLRQILANNLRDEVRKLGAAARDIGRERSLEAALDTSSSRLEGFLAANQSSPSEQAMRQERMVALATALTCLSDDQRLAVELHHLKGCPLADVAWQLGKSKGAVAALLFRGLRRLRSLLAEKTEGDR